MSVNDILYEIEKLHKEEVNKIEQDFKKKSSIIFEEEKILLSQIEEETKKEISNKEKQLLEK
jgi:hypothetical protein